MELTLHNKQLEPAMRVLVNHLRDHQDELRLGEATAYHKFPLYRDDDGELLIAPLLIVSPRHGLVILASSDATPHAAVDMTAEVEQLDHIVSAVYSRLLRNKQLRATSRELKLATTAILFAPFWDGPRAGPQEDTFVATSPESLGARLEEVRCEELSELVVREARSTIEGAKGLVRVAKRPPAISATTKGALVGALEAEIASFDEQQKNAYLFPVQGPERIRGLAGSGKTVILCMKAALQHLREPDATICYTFYTKSLYQHIRRLITRFYRQFNDQDPDWTRLQVLHGWGGFSAPGVYFLSCVRHGVTPLAYGDVASRVPHGQEFDFVCNDLLQRTTPTTLFDYTFIDEGQDFPGSFLRLCRAITKDQRFVWAYDELQTLFQAASPTVEEVFGSGFALTSDTVLHKCYRNPREILVCAHALGFGLYGRIAQMLENNKQWEDIGYRVVSGTCNPGTSLVIERPAENSPLSISTRQSLDAIVQQQEFKNLGEEVEFVATSIERDLADGLRPDDILVITVDDRNARNYLQSIEKGLSRRGIQANNTHVDAFGLMDFAREDRVTLSTVHKAKGNEAFVVYVVGTDAVFVLPDVRSRNKLFTAMTRAKGWVCLSGIGESAHACNEELRSAKEQFPVLRFTYPDPEGLRVMRRDLIESAEREREIERLLEQLQAQVPDGDVGKLIRRRAEAQQKGSPKTTGRQRKR